jgi:hypothetical protein
MRFSEIRKKIDCLNVSLAIASGVIAAAGRNGSRIWEGKTVMTQSVRTLGRTTCLRRIRDDEYR